MKKQKYTNPFLIQITSGSEGKHCDLYPHGSIHKVKRGEDGFLWVDGRIDIIRPEFESKEIDEMLETKECPSCINQFQKDWPFIFDKNTQETLCIRCYERRNIFDREIYREAVRQELLMEQKKSI